MWWGGVVAGLACTHLALPSSRQRHIYVRVVAGFSSKLSWSVILSRVRQPLAEFGATEWEGVHSRGRRMVPLSLSIGHLDDDY